MAKTQIQIRNEIRELDRRRGDGLEVALLWESRTDRVFVSIVDHRRDVVLEVSVDPADALDAFRHPFAYVPVGAAGTEIAA